MDYFAGAWGRDVDSRVRPVRPVSKQSLEKNFCVVTSQPREGVIKFNLEFSHASAPALDGIAALNAWRQILFRLGLTGRDPGRYDGLAYGNVSQRTEAGRFIVSGTQTGGKPFLGAEDYCLVLDFNLEENRLCAKGLVEPSSEALTHGAVYKAVWQAGCVIHVHSPEIWRHARLLGILVTSESIPYGTPEMGLAVGQAALDSTTGVIAMGGHEDGILAFAECPQEAATRLLRCLAKAVELDLRG
jgi:hypothetical protein